MATMKFVIQQFNGLINFGMWKVRMMAVLTQQNLKIVLDGKDKKPATVKDFEWEEADHKALSTIQLSIIDDILEEVLSKKIAAAL